MEFIMTFSDIYKCDLTTCHSPDPFISWSLLLVLFCRFPHPFFFSFKNVALDILACTEKKKNGLKQGCNSFLTIYFYYKKDISGVQCSKKKKKGIIEIMVLASSGGRCI